MLKNTSIHLLCIILAFSASPSVSYAGTRANAVMTEDDIREHYPEAKIIHTTEENYPQVAQDLRAQGFYLAANSSTDDRKNNQANVSRRTTSDDCNTSGRQDTDPSASEDSIRVVVDITDDMLRSGNQSNSPETAAIVFVIIGTVIIVVWALYVFKYLYDIAAGFKPCGRWTEFAFASSFISSTPAQHIDFNGLRFMTGFRDGITEVGIAVELGHSDILLTEASSLELEGLYWFLGPVLRWRLSAGNNPHYFQMNFMGGSTEHDEIGVIARASLGVRLGLGQHTHLGVSWGAMNIKLNNDQGIITERDQYHYLFGVNFGLQF